MNEILLCILLAVNVIASIALFVIAINATNKFYDGKSIKKHITCIIALGIVMYMAVAVTAILLTQQTFKISVKN